MKSRPLVMALVLCAGCPTFPDEPEERAPLPSVLPVLPTVEDPKSDGTPPPAWASLLPKSKVNAKPSDRVWATPPQEGSDIPSVGVYTVDDVDDMHASVIDKLGQKVRNVPGAVIHPLIEDHKFREGELALCYSLTTPGVLARVSAVNRGYIVSVAYDWGGETKEGSMDHCGPLRTELAPLALVSFPKTGTRSIGLIIALGPQRAWIRTDSGHIEVHDRKPLQVVRMAPRGYQVGDKVRAYRWASGVRVGTITAVAEPELRFEVKFPGDAPSTPYFVTELLSP